MSLLRGMELMSRDKSVDLTGVLSWRASLFECLDIVYSAYDKFVACDFTSLIQCFLNP